MNMASPIPGFHGCYLRVDLTTGVAERVPLEESLLRGRKLGGSPFYRPAPTGAAIRDRCATQYHEVMIAQHADSAFPEGSYEAQDAQTLRTAIHQIADKPQPVFGHAITYCAE